MMVCREAVGFERFVILRGSHKEQNMYHERLKKEDWEVRIVDLSTARNLVEQFHYAKGGSNTATYRHGLFRKGHFLETDCVAVAW